MRTHTKKLGEIAQGVPSKDAKTCFFCHQYNMDFRPLLAPIVSILEIKTCVRMRKPLKNFRRSVQGFYRFPKELKMGTFEGCL